MKDSIRLSLTFSFRGETFSPQVVLDLEQLNISEDGPPDLHHILAIHNGIDTYSYAYEVMQQAGIIFDRPTGLAVACLHDDGRFDLEQYLQKREEVRLLMRLQAIAADTLQIQNLEDSPAIRDALLQAYRLGRQD